MSTNNILSETVSITQPLLKSFRSAYGRYRQDLEDKKENEKKKKKNEELQQLKNELNWIEFVEYVKKVEEKKRRIKWSKAGLLFDLKKRIHEVDFNDNVDLNIRTHERCKWCCINHDILQNPQNKSMGLHFSKDLFDGLIFGGRGWGLYSRGLTICATKMHKKFR